MMTATIMPQIPRIPAMTTGMSDFMTTPGLHIEMLLIPVPALAVPYAAPKSQFQWVYWQGRGRDQLPQIQRMLLLRYLEGFLRSLVDQLFITNLIHDKNTTSIFIIHFPDNFLYREDREHLSALFGQQLGFLFYIKFIFNTVKMNQSFSTFSKLSNVSAKLSNRRQQGERANEGQGDLYKISAKIRELEDDLRTILDENSEIQKENNEMTKVLQEIQYVVNVQQQRMDELAQCLEKDLNATETIAQYQSDLLTVAQQTATLNELIKDKNGQYGMLFQQKQDLLYEKSKLKEQLNTIHFKNNTLQHQLDTIISLQEDQPHTFNEDLDRKAEVAIQRIREKLVLLNNVKKNIEQIRRENNAKIKIQKEKRIKLEYQIKLLNERRTDQSKKESYYKQLYNQERVQQVIDDMLAKEDTLRQQIAEFEQLNQKINVDGTIQLDDLQRKIQRNQHQRQQDIRILRLEVEILSEQISKLKNKEKQVDSRIEQVQSQGLQIQSWQEQSDGEIWVRIRQTQKENLELQRRFSQLGKEVQQLERELLGH